MNDYLTFLDQASISIDHSTLGKRKNKVIQEEIKNDHHHQQNIANKRESKYSLKDREPFGSLHMKEVNI